MTDWIEQVREAALQALPPVEGEVVVPGLEATVEVLRDRWGVPHITARTLDDLFLAQGFVVASERLFQLDMLLRLANGRLSTLLGDLTLPMDRFVRTVGWNRAGARIVAGYDDLSRRMMSAYLAGVEAWIGQMPAPPIEYVVLATTPAVPTGADADAYWASASAMTSWGLSGNLDEELLRAAIAERLGWDAMRDLFPSLPFEAPSIVAGKRSGSPTPLELLHAVPAAPRGQGSNNWVVSGSRTASGRPLLANDPHLTVQTPSLWFECHLAAPDYEASGVAFPFAPGIVIGHTAHHAWGLTNVGGDTQDLYQEVLSEDGTAALYEGTWEPVTVHREEIEVRGREEPSVIEVRYTRHGPILDAYLLGRRTQQVVEGGVRERYALRWVGAEVGVEPSVLVRMAIAESFDAFRAALADWHSPGQNVVYADVDGTIGYQCTGRYPVRAEGHGTVPVPGWTAEHEWVGTVPFEELPWCVDPEEGFIATANNRIHDETYPHLITMDWTPSFRVRRIAELLTATDRHTSETFGRIQVDTVSLSARALLPLLREVRPATDRQAEVLALLEGWDADLLRDSAAACLYEVWIGRIAEAMLLPRLGEDLFAQYYARSVSTSPFPSEVLPAVLANPTARWFGAEGREARDRLLLQALDAAIDELSASLGDDQLCWRWGGLHRTVFAHPLAMLGDLAALFTAGEVEAGGDETTVNNTAYEPGSGHQTSVLASWRQIVDLGDVDASVGTHTVGQSGHPASDHWNDLVPLWGEGRYHPLPFTRLAVEEAAAATLNLVPR